MTSPFAFLSAIQIQNAAFVSILSIMLGVDSANSICLSFDDI